MPQTAWVELAPKEPQSPPPLRFSPPEDTWGQQGVWWGVCRASAVLGGGRRNAGPVNAGPAGTLAQERELASMPRRWLFASSLLPNRGGEGDLLSCHLQNVCVCVCCVCFENGLCSHLKAES